MDARDHPEQMTRQSDLCAHAGMSQGDAARRTFHFYPTQPQNASVIITFLLLFPLQTQKPRLREIKYLAQGYTARRGTWKDECGKDAQWKGSIFSDLQLTWVGDGQ